MPKQHIRWLDSLKLLSALGIFLGHYLCAFYNLCEIKPDLNEMIVTILRGPLGFLTNGSYCIYIFCILSGYFAKRKKVHNLREVWTAITSRYLRFAFSLLFANLFIYLIFCCNGFYTVEVGTELSNSWLAKYYSFNIDMALVIKGAFLFSPKLNGPLWTLKYIFIGTCMIYIYNYLCEKWRRAYIDAAFAIAGIAFCLYVIIFREEGLQNRYLYSVACFGGVILDKIWEKENFYSNKKQIIFTVILIGILDLVNGRHNLWLNWLEKYIVIPNFMFLNLFWYFIYGIAFLICINKVNWIKNILELECFNKINNLSFDIYVFHWPLTCSFSLFVYLQLIGNFSYTGTWVLNLLLTVFVVIAWAKIYDITIEKHILNRILKVGLHKYLERI